MGKKLQDYIQYYIGCKCVRTDITSTGYQYSLYAYDCDPLSRAPYYIGSDSGYYWVREIKPILRKLDSMDDADIKSFLNWNRLNELYVDVSYKKEELAIILNYSIPCDGDIVYPQSVTIMPKIELRSDQFDHLIKNGFDLFDLIESGLAIDASTLTK